MPVLVHGDQVFCESDLISWYLAEKFDTGTQLIFDDPAKKLKMRFIINTCSSPVISAFYSFKGWDSKSEEEKKKCFDKA